MTEPNPQTSRKPGLADALQSQAAARGLALHDDGDLAALIRSAEIGHAIPVAAFIAIAGILNHLFRADQRLADGQP